MVRITVERLLIDEAQKKAPHSETGVGGYPEPGVCFKSLHSYRSNASICGAWMLLAPHLRTMLAGTTYLRHWPGMLARDIWRLRFPETTIARDDCRRHLQYSPMTLLTALARAPIGLFPPPVLPCINTRITGGPYGRPI